MPCNDCSRAENCPPCVNEGEEPPLTPEEEEEVAEDEPFVQSCVRPGCVYDVETDCRYGCRAAADDLTELGQEMEQRPPQPERRPPIAVAYSVSGHVYEVHVAGDAAVKAVDGVLIIQHHLGPVAGLVQVLPVITKGGVSGAE